MVSIVVEIYWEESVLSQSVKQTFDLVPTYIQIVTMPKRCQMLRMTRINIG